MNLRLWLIPLLPLLGGIINGLFGRLFSKRVVTAVALASTAAAFAMALYVAANFASMPADQIPHAETLSFPWISITGFEVDFAFFLDQLSLIMLLVVTGVGFLIHIYSAGYMADEEGYYRFFSYLNLFMFFMLTLVLAANYLLMFVGWEGVGLASYLLIGFYFQKQSAANAGKKAFITNRIGDFAFLLGMFLLIKTFGSVDYLQVFHQVSAMGVEHAHAGILTWTALLMMIGATGKSAQIPLYVWLPDAMEGPTPVSALIHAATMVTAGIYMVARSSAIFDRAPIALTVVAILGALTAFFAATIGLVQTDIKRVLAYSTISQLGYMFMACGVAAYSAAIFHLMTHAFFKALLFLAAGSVIHALGGEQDMRNMGGLKDAIPYTFWTMAIATLAISGIPPLAGFFSKDEILWQAFSSKPTGWIFWLIGLITAGMTAFYMFRLLFMTFFGERRAPQYADTHQGHAAAAGHGHKPGHGVHESPWIMLGPLVILAFLSVAGGWVGVPKALGGQNHFEQFLAPVFEQYAPHDERRLAEAEAGVVGPAANRNEPVPENPESATELIMTGVSVLVALTGAFFAWLFYYKRPELPQRIVQHARGLYTTLLNKYYVDEFYGATLTQPIMRGATDVLWRGVDVGIIDASVNEAATASQEVSRGVRRMQSGNLRSYAGWVAFGAALVIGYMIWTGIR